MAKKYIKIESLSVSTNLANFVDNDLLIGIDIDKKKFWEGFNNSVHELAPKNKKLLKIRENLQKKIDLWHKDKKGEKINIKEYSNFLIEIGYLKKEGEAFQIETKNVDSEISTI